MKKIKRIVVIIIVIFVMSSTLIKDCNEIVRAATENGGPIQVAVFLLDFTNGFLSGIHRSLEEIEKQNEDKVKFTFYDAKADQTVQDQQINEALSKGVDLILLDIVNIGDAQKAINKVKDINIPIILFNREPVTPAPIQSYSKAFYVGTDPKQAGALQGKMLVDVWNTSRELIDKNRDRTMQYIMLQGESDNKEAIERSKNSTLTVEKAGIKTQQIAIEICNWREELAYEATKNLFSKYGTQIEVIIANNDDMALGAIKALQESGYNNGYKLKTIPVVGVDLIPKAREFIEKGYMLGSVLQDSKVYAEALYTIGMNLVNKRSPIEGSKYQLDDTRTAIRIPQTEILYKNIYSS